MAEFQNSSTISPRTMHTSSLWILQLRISCTPEKSEWIVSCTNDALHRSYIHKCVSRCTRSHATLENTQHQYSTKFTYVMVASYDRMRKMPHNVMVKLSTHCRVELVSPSISLTVCPIILLPDRHHVTIAVTYAICPNQHIHSFSPSRKSQPSSHSFTQPQFPPVPHTT